MSRVQNYLILGATGRQGSATVSALFSHPSAPSASQVYVVTRSTKSASAQRLVSQHPGLNLVQGSLANAVEIFSQIPKPSLPTLGVFLMQPDDPAHDIEQGTAFIDQALAHGVSHIVFSSVDRGVHSDTEKSYVPHFATKWEVEQHLKKAAAARQGKLTYTILRPVFFMENLTWGFLGKVVSTGLRDRLGQVQVVAARDVGRWAAEALLFPDEARLRDKGLSIASDRVDFARANEIFEREVGRPVDTTFWFVSAAIIYLVGNVNKMFRWFGEVPGGADIDALSERLPATSFEQWARTVGEKEKEKKSS